MAGIPVTNNVGWYYWFDNNLPQGTITADNYKQNAGRYKAINPTFAMANFLYVNVYDRDDNVDPEGNANVGGCGSTSGKLAGSTYVYRFCLPTGKCNKKEHGTDVTSNPKSTERVGMGIAGVNFGYRGKNSKGNNQIGLVSGSGKNGGDVFSLEAKVKVLRWYESRSGQ